MFELEILQCDRCLADLEEGQIGMCDDCQDSEPDERDLEEDRQEARLQRWEASREEW